MADAITVSIVLAYFVVTLALGFFAARKIKTAEHYYGARKLFGMFVTAVAVFSGIASAFTFIGGPGLVYPMGGTVNWVIWTPVISMPLIWYLLGKRIKLITEARPVATLPDLTAARFKSDAVRFLTAVALIFGIITYLAGNVMGAGLVLTDMLGTPLELSIAIVFGIIMLYTAFGGMVASILTDFFQGLVMMVAAIIFVVFILIMTGGVENLFATIAESNPRHIDPIGVGPIWLGIMGWWWALNIGSSVQPHAVTKFFALKDYRDLKWGALVTTIAWTLACLMWFFGGYASVWVVIKGLAEAPARSDQAIFGVIAQMPVVLKAVIYAGVLAAIMSTVSGFISMGTAAVVRDIPTAIGKSLSQRGQILWGRVVTVILTVAAALFGYYGGYVVGILVTLGLGYFASMLFPLLVIGLNWKRATKEAAIITTALTVAMNLGFLVYEKVLSMSLPYGLPGYGVTFAVGIITMVLVSLVTKGAALDDMDEDIRAAMSL